MPNNELRKALHGLELQDIQLSGCESLFSDVVDTISGAIVDGAKFVGTKTAEGLVKGFKEANTAIIKTLGTRRMFLSHLNSKLSNEDVKSEVTFPASLLKKYTYTGKPGDIAPSIDRSSKVFGHLLNYTKEIEALYHRQLSILEGVAKIETTEDATRLLQEFNGLKLPEPKSTDHNGSNYMVWDLPGGRTIEYMTDNKRVEFVGGKEVLANEVTESFAKEDLKAIISKLNTLADSLKSITSANDHYVDYLKKFNTVVGKANEHLESLRGEISASLINDLSKRLEGNTLVFTFYTGFLPKAVIYLDDYVDTLSSFVSKQFN